MKSKINDSLLEEKIAEILSNENRGLSIREITKVLLEKYEIKRSPQIVLRHLEKLKIKRRVLEENGEKI